VLLRSFLFVDFADVHKGKKENKNRNNYHKIPLPNFSANKKQNFKNVRFVLLIEFIILLPRQKNLFFRLMGSAVSGAWHHLFGAKKVSILCVGMEGSGKTTLLYKIDMGITSRICPTPVSVDILDQGNVRWISFNAIFLHNYYSYCKDIDYLVYLIDSNNREQINEAAKHLNTLLTFQALQGLPLLVFCNKQDLPDVMSVDEIVEKLQLNLCGNRPWNAHPCSFITGEGLTEGLEWLSSDDHPLTRRNTTKSARS
jgi:hypothetical protein